MPDCYQELTHADSAILTRSAIKARFRKTFTDPTAKETCEKLLTAFVQAVAAHEVFRGNTGIGDGKIAHGSETYLGVIHIDGEYLDKAENSPDPAVRSYYRDVVVNLALHEAAHWSFLENGWSGSHGSDEYYGHYTTFPYYYASGGSGKETCVP